MGEPSKKFIGAYLEDNIHRMLCRVGSSLGKHPSDMAADLIAKGLAQFVSDDEANLPLEIRLYRKQIQMQTKPDVKIILRNMAVSYSLNSNEDDREILESAIAEAGYTIDEVRSWIDDDRLTPLSQGDPALNQAVTFLQHFMEMGEEYDNKDVKAAAENAGITKGMLETARKRLEIRSYRGSTCFVWIRDK